MEDIIYINFIYIYDKLFFFKLNDKLTIKINYLNDLTLFENSFDINCEIYKNINDKQYFIKIPKIIINNLTVSNFIVNLPKYYYYDYAYYKNDKHKSIIIYKDYNYLPLIYLGLPNLKSKKYFKINYKYKEINSNVFSDCSGNIINDCNCDIDCSGNYTSNSNCQITLFNNYFGNSNYFLNRIKLKGNIYEICINNNGITSFDNGITHNYKLFKIKNNLDIDINTNIYFYDDTSGNYLSYIINLNSYNFSPIKNIPIEQENLIANINYITDSSGSVYNSILSLNMQTFNPNQLCQTNLDSSGNFYYNTLFFFNYINPNYTVDYLNIFSYDYDKYFDNTEIPLEFYNVNYCQHNLYDYIINLDSNLSIPIILNILEPYLFINLDFINLDIRLINMVNYANDFFYKSTNSNKINLDILVKYLINFTIKKYNVFKLTNIRNIDNNDNVTTYDIVRNELYGYLSLYVKSYLYKDPNEYINFNNNVVNCIRCKVIFYYKSNTNMQINGYYEVDAKLFLNNYNLELYHKKYNFENESSDINKIKLINLLLFLQTTTYQIKLYFYNKKNSVIPAYYIYNQVDLFKNINDFETTINVELLNNTYTNGYLKYNIQVNKKYYILFLYADIDSFLNLSNYDELIFYNNKITFKILKIDKPNGNTLENKLLFYISFQNLKEINMFMKYISTGILDTNNNNTNLSTYFNIQNSITFYNYYELNNYWIKEEGMLPNKHKINFSINNLYLNQIYLYGNLFINCVI